MHLSRGLACSQKMSWVVVLFCVLALSLEQGGVETKSVDQQELPSCDRAYGFFASINVTIKPANNDQGNYTAEAFTTKVVVVVVESWKVCCHHFNCSQNNFKKLMSYLLLLTVVFL